MSKYTEAEKAEIQELQTKLNEPTPESFGVSGTPLTQSRPLETNPSLMSVQQWVYVARSMMSDPAIAASWGALKQTLLSAKFSWRSAEPGDPEADKYAEYAQRMWSNLDTPFEQQLVYLLEFLPIGFRYAEELYKVVDGEVMLSQYADREPSAHNSFIREDENGTLVAVSQSSSLAGRVGEPIPASKLLLLTHELTGQNFGGIGLLRPIYYPWKLKAHAQNQLGIGIQRWASPVPVIDLDRSVVSGENKIYERDEYDRMVENAKAEAQRLVSMEQGYLVQNTGLKWTVLDGTAAALQGATMINDVIAAQNNEIFTNFLVQFLTLGVSDSGSRGVSETMESFFRRAAINYLDLVVGAINGPARPGGGTIGRLVEYNFSDVDQAKLPILVHSGLQAEAIMDFIDKIPSLITSGIITGSSDIEQKLRSVLGLDALTVEEEAEIAENSEENPNVGASQENTDVIEETVSEED